MLFSARVYQRIVFVRSIVRNARRNALTLLSSALVCNLYETREMVLGVSHSHQHTIDPPDQ